MELLDPEKNKQLFRKEFNFQINCFVFIFNLEPHNEDEEVTVVQSLPGIL